MKRVIILVVIGLFVAGCEVLSRPSNLFENPVCEPPCWENITPGITTKTDALAILSQIDAIDQPIVDPKQPFIRFDDAIHFTFYNDINRLGFLYILDDRVSMIGFAYKLDITLQKAIEFFGPPQSVLVVRSGEFDGVTFLNPEKGITFGYRFHLDESYEIRPNDEIDGVSFFDPDQYQLYLDSGFFSYASLNADEVLQNIQPWKGYGSIDQYMTPLKP